METLEQSVWQRQIQKALVRLMDPQQLWEMEEFRDFYERHINVFWLMTNLCYAPELKEGSGFKYMSSFFDNLDYHKI